MDISQHHATRPTMGLTAKAVQAARARDKDYMLSDGNCLYLRVYHTGTKVWIFRERKAGKATVTKLGEYPAMSLKDARVKASKHRLSGSPDTMRISELVDAYYTKRIIGTGYKRPEQTRAYFNTIKLEFGSRKVADITRAMLASSIESYSERGARSADRYRSYLKLIFRYAADRGIITNSPMADIGSASLTGYHYKPVVRVLEGWEIVELWNWGSVAANVLRFQLLTGLRISEVFQGRLDGDRWVVDTTKTGASHWVHVTEFAMEQLPITCKSDSIVRTLLGRWFKQTGKPKYTSHDTRRTFATLCGECSIDPIVIEMLLNHSLPGMLKVYQKHDYEAERIDAAIRISDHVQNIIYM